MRILRARFSAARLACAARARLSLSMGAALSEAGCCSGEAPDASLETSVPPPPASKVPAPSAAPAASTAAAPAASTPTTATSAPAAAGSDVATLVDMGYERSAAESALEAAQGDLGKAAQILSDAGPATGTEQLAVPTTSADDQKIAMLVGMGFDAAAAQAALDGAGGDVGRAANHLTGA